MKWKKVGNVCGIIAAVLFSVMLLVVLVVTPLAASVQQFTVPDNLSDIIGEIDFTEIVKENEGFQQQMKTMGIPAEAVNEVMHSEIVEDITDLYEQDLSAALSGTQGVAAFTPEAVLNILTENTDEITEFARQYVPGADKLDEEKLKKQVETTIKEQGEAVTTFVPPATELATSLGADPSYGDLTPLQEGVAFVRDTLMLILYIALGVLTVLLLAVRYYHLRGLLWAGVTFAGSGVVTLLLALGVDGIFSLVKTMAPAEISGLLSSLSPVFSGQLYPFAIIYLSVGTVMLVGFIVATHFFNKPTAAQPALPATQ